jgi:hypothetical protein
MLLKSDKGFVQFVDENGPEKDWQFTVVCRNGEVGLIVPISLKTGEVIELGQRMNKCIFVKPEEYADLIEELEAMRDDPRSVPEALEELDSRDDDWMMGFAKAMDLAVRLVAQRANPPPGVE